MVRFEPMSLDHYTEWRQMAVREYAEDKIRVENVAPEDALADSKRDFDKLLPDGLATADNHLYALEDLDDGHRVGMLWVKIRNQGQEMFIYDIRIDEQFRGMGYGRHALKVLEMFTRDMGIPKISLHVFGDNEIALNVYRRMGFVATNILMSKVLTD